MKTQTSNPKTRPIYLKTPATETFIPLAAGFVGQAAKGLGLEGEAADELALAAEEVIAYIIRLGDSGQDIEIRCFAGSHFIEADVCLPVRDLQLRAFNMTASLCADDESCLDQMGLLIASRMTDRFRISRQGSGNLLLTLVKELQYPEIDPAELKVEMRPVSNWRIETPDAARIKWLVRLVNQCYPASFFPMSFRYPGKVVDMAAAGDYHLLVAQGPGGEIGGGIAWKWEGLKTVEVLGPFVFHKDSGGQMASDLLEACIVHVARTSALVLVSRMPTPEMPKGYLEALAAKTTGGAERGEGPPIACFRLMHEDMGCVVWAHSELTDFLQHEYRRLFFPRDIQTIHADGEAIEPHSVLSADLDHELNRVTLRPIWPGADREENLAGHIELFKQEAFSSIFFEMDLGVSWQAEFTPGLLKLGFAPAMILPYAGTADLVVFKLEIPLP